VVADEDEATLSDEEKPSSDESVAKSRAGSEVDDEAVVAVDVIVDVAVPALLVDEALEARLEMAVSLLDVVADSALSGPVIAATAEVRAAIGIDCDCFAISFVSGKCSEVAMASLLFAAAALPLADNVVSASLCRSCPVAADLSCAARCSGASGHLSTLCVWCCGMPSRRT